MQRGVGAALGALEPALDVRVGGQVPREGVAAEAQGQHDGGRQRRDLQQAASKQVRLGIRTGEGEEGGGAPNILGDTSQVLTQSSEAEGVACAQARIVPLQNGNWTAERRAAPSAEYRRMSGRVMGEAKRELTSGLSHLKVDRVC